MNIEKVKREEQILLSLKRFDFLTRSQLQRIHNLKGTRNANRVLKEMEKYLNNFRSNENIYFLNREGREKVECQKVCRVNSRLEHTIMRNQLYIFFGLPHNWQNEMKIKFKGKSVVADAVFKKNTVQHIVEVDHEQKMITNIKKVSLYQELNELMDFKLIWLTCTDYRRNKLKSICDKLDCLFFTMNDIK